MAGNRGDAVARKVILDCDPGQDDAVAILLALASPELEVLGITTVAGNVPLALTQRNARQVVELSGRSVPVMAGRDRPLVRPLVTAEHVHGKTGLDGIALPEPSVPLDPRDGVRFIVETLRREPEGTVTLCPLGPLTNVAAAFREAPDVAGRVQQIVLMGGGFFEGGNITPAAEFNIYVDPEAAAEVLASGRPLTIVPLDCSHGALTSRARIAAFRALGTRAGEVVASWLDFFERFDVEKYGSQGGPLHDPLVIAWLLRPGLFASRRINVEVETGSDLTRGMTVADWWGVTDRPRNATWARSVDADGYFALLTERIGRL